MRAGFKRSFFYLAVMAGSAGAAFGNDAQGVSPISAPGVAMIAVLAVCVVALVGLVVTLPAVKNGFCRVLHIGPGLPPHTITDAHRSS
jgi:hypothetical protein